MIVVGDHLKHARGEPVATEAQNLCLKALDTEY